MTKVGGIFTRYLTPALKILLVMGQSLGRKMEKFRLIVVISRPNHRKILFQSFKKVIFNSYHEKCAKLNIILKSPQMPFFFF